MESRCYNINDCCFHVVNCNNKEPSFAIDEPYVHVLEKKVLYLTVTIVNIQASVECFLHVYFIKVITY